MKISELKPCDLCGGPIVPIHYKVTIETLGIDANKVNQTMGFAQMMGGSLPLAEIMGPHDDVLIEMDRQENIVCIKCIMKPIVMLIGDGEN